MQYPNNSKWFNIEIDHEAATDWEGRAQWWTDDDGGSGNPVWTDSDPDSFDENRARETMARANKGRGTVHGNLDKSHSHFQQWATKWSSASFEYG